MASAGSDSVPAAPRVLGWPEIESVLPSIDPVAEMEKAFVAYSAGRCVVPPVGELRFEDPPGDVHIKYGYVRGDQCYVVKIASGFYDNPALGLSSSNGLMLLFDQRTGVLLAVLLDEGRLTDIRTAAAGAVAARHLAPSQVREIGIVGTGIQARLQLEFLRGIVDCDRAVVWGRNPDHAAKYCMEMSSRGLTVEAAASLAELGERSNLIVTTTPAESPLLLAEHLQPGTHITAMGSDTPSKQELESSVLARADLVVADSIQQTQERGEVAHALRAGVLKPDFVVELGSVVDASVAGRQSDDQITVADLTGVAVQDVMISAAVFAAAAAG